MSVQKDFHQPKRQPVSHGVAIALWDQLVVKSHTLTDSHPKAWTQWWSNSTSVKGIRRLHICMFIPNGYMPNKPVEEELVKVWLSNMLEIINNHNLQDYVKVHCFRGVWYVKLWYKSDGVVYHPHVKWLPPERGQYESVESFNSRKAQ
jgi:hypothetical protein